MVVSPRCTYERGAVCRSRRARKGRRIQLPRVRLDGIVRRESVQGKLVFCLDAVSEISGVEVSHVH